ncbi:MAG: pantoate--beta-alanine ligase [Rhodospirillales bacterium]|nr:pantoate--beta-alanine ligase [Rhodospirillales bacterium]
MIKTVTTIADLRSEIRTWRQAGETVGLVPTMGALHEGHLALVRQSRAKTMRTAATLFVNPKQFAPHEDLATYPREEADDLAKLEKERVDLLFKPEASEIYPPGHATKVMVEGLGDILEGECRPGFFTGVATVVTKLLVQALPDAAFFGEKDYQQLQVIKRLARDLDIPVRIEGVATVREADGLALSSRNAYLNQEERAIAPALHGTIAQVAENVGRGSGAAEQAEWGLEQLQRAGFAKVDYLTVRDAKTLEEVADASRPARVLAAAWLGKARLIDNVAV